MVIVGTADNPNDVETTAVRKILSLKLTREKCIMFGKAKFPHHPQNAPGVKNVFPPSSSFYPSARRPPIIMLVRTLVPLFVCNTYTTTHAQDASILPSSAYFHIIFYCARVFRRLAIYW